MWCCCWPPSPPTGFSAGWWRGRGPRRRFWLWAAVVLNLAGLFIFKYLGFVCRNLGALGLPMPEIDLALPIGISFYTFQAMSYVIDVYRRRSPAQRSVLDVGLYVSFFPQLIAGPIVRYETIAQEIHAGGRPGRTSGAVCPDSSRAWGKR